jgi:nitroimidazol reductase NimA-like FMN-containing flavoprotein (pyridoxamine 5'-phosphate oxidase superfamily)
MSQPQTTRPRFPEGYLENPKSMVPWSYVEQRLAAAKNYWVCSVRPNSNPHVIPVWAVWVDGCIYFDGSPETRHARNIASNPNIAVHLESGDDVLIVEGTTQMLQTVAQELGKKVAQAYSAKYAEMGYSPQPDQWNSGGLFQVRPQTVLAWTKFTDDPTKFVLRAG